MAFLHSLRSIKRFSSEQEWAHYGVVEREKPMRLLLVLHIRKLISLDMPDSGICMHVHTHTNVSSPRHTSDDRELKP